MNPFNGIGHRAVRDADRRRASLLTMAPLFAELMGDNVRRLELAYDAAIPAERMALAKQADADHRAACQADPLLDAQDRLREAETERDVALMALRPLVPFLAEHAGEPDTAYVGRPHADGSHDQHMGDHRADAARLRERVIAAVVQVACLNMAIGRLIREAA